MARVPFGFRIFVFAGPLVWIAMLWVMWSSAQVDFGARAWQEFDQILVAEQDHAAAVQRLRAAGEAVITFEDASVSMEDFNGGELVSLAVLDQRFDPADPRVDPFVASLKDLFVVGGDSQRFFVLYVERSDSLLQRWFGLRRLLAGIPFELAGWRPIEPLASGAAVWLSLLPIVFLARRRRWLVIMIQLTVSVYALVGGPHAIVPAGILGMAWSYWHVHGYDWERELLIHGRWVVPEREQMPSLVLLVASVVVVVVTMIIDVPRSTDAPIAAAGSTTVAALGALVVLSGWAFALQALRVGRSEHRLFAPRPILRGKASFSGLVPTASLLVVAVVAGSLVASASGLTTDTPIPMPEHLPLGQPRDAGSGDGRSEDAQRAAAARLVEGLRSTSPSEEPLSTAGYIAHRWYQSSLMFGGAYEVPRLGASILMQRLRRGDGGSLEAYQEEVRRFDTAWLISQFDAPEGTAYRLFVRERGAFRVVEASPGLPSVSAARLAVDLILLLVPFITLTVTMRLPYRGLLGTVGAASRSERHGL